jgi:hypothetical protein
MQLIPLAFWQEKWTHQPTGAAYWYSLGWLTQCLGGYEAFALSNMFLLMSTLNKI